MVVVTAVVTIFEYQYGTEPLAQIQQLSEIARTSNGFLVFMCVLLPVMGVTEQIENRQKALPSGGMSRAVEQQRLTSADQGVLARDEQGRYRFSA